MSENTGTFSLGDKPITTPGVTPQGAPPRTMQRASAKPSRNLTQRPLPDTTSLDAPAASASPPETLIASAAPPDAAQTRVRLPYIPEAPIAQAPATRRAPAGSGMQLPPEMLTNSQPVFPAPGDPRTEKMVPLSGNPLDLFTAAPHNGQLTQRETPATVARIQLEQKPIPITIAREETVEPDIAELLNERLAAMELRLAAVEEMLDAQEIKEDTAQEAAAPCATEQEATAGPETPTDTEPPAMDELKEPEVREEVI